MTDLKWTRSHESTCGRFWCYKPPRADEWQLWDRADRDDRGNARRHYHRFLADAKDHARRIAAGAAGN